MRLLLLFLFCFQMALAEIAENDVAANEGLRESVVKAATEVLKQKGQAMHIGDLQTETVKKFSAASFDRYLRDTIKALLYSNVQKSNTELFWVDHSVVGIKGRDRAAADLHERLVPPTTGKPLLRETAEKRSDGKKK